MSEPDLKRKKTNPRFPMHLQNDCPTHCDRPFYLIDVDPYNILGGIIGSNRWNRP